MKRVKTGLVRTREPPIKCMMLLAYRLDRRLPSINMVHERVQFGHELIHCGANDVTIQNLTSHCHDMIPISRCLAVIESQSAPHII